MAQLISEKVFFRVNNIIKDKYGHFKMIREFFYLEDTSVFSSINVITKATSYEVKNDRNVRRNRQIQNYIRKFNIQHSNTDKVSIQPIIRNIKG